MERSTQPIENKNIETMLPEVDGSVFGNSSNASFWVGGVAARSLVTAPDCYEPLLKFRGNIYVHECGYLPLESLDEEGRELDRDDARSFLFAAIENSEDVPRVVGSARLISKDSEREQLPVEDYFPEIFDQQPIKEGESSEVSRYIARHPNKFVQGMVSIALVRAMIHACTENNFQNAYAMLEDGLLQKLTQSGIEAEQLGNPKYVDDLKGVLYPVVFKPFNLIDSLISESESAPTASQLFFKFDQNRNGQGFYEQDLLRNGNGNLS